MKGAGTVLATTLLLFTACSQAALVTLQGTDVDFVIEDSQAGLAIYGGLPTVIGNALLFSPTGFRAESNNGAGTVSDAATIVFDIVARVGQIHLGRTSVTEVGDYFVTPGSQNSVNAVAQLGAINLDAANPAASFVQDVQETGPLSADGANIWDLTTSIDFMLAWSNPTSHVRVDLQNNLSATSIAQATQSWIQKKFNGMLVEVAVVPVPAAIWLLLSAFGSLLAFKRKA
jgi:hypothetical protein